MRNFFVLLVSGLLFSCQAPAGSKPAADSTNNVVAAPDTSRPAPGNVPAADTTTLTGEWFLLPVLPSDTGAGRIPRLVFDLGKNRFSGSTGCNNMSGTFRRTDTSLVFSEEIITTKMACPGYNEANFLKNLLRTNRYSFRDGMLILQFGETELSRWSHKPPVQSAINKA